MMMSMNGRSRNPFTASQWQELEHQALAYKYMITGMPIPPDLLFSIKTSFNSSISSNFLLHQTAQQFGWSNGFQIGYGKKIDPEPGRCRRTDGKKWRCSKEASSDSKYCERHMHRGRNRSRKPVENNTSTTIDNTSKTIAPKTTHSSSSSSNYLYPHFSTSDSLEIALSSQENNTSSFFLDSNAYSTKDYRKSYGQEMNEHAFLTEASSTNYGTRRNDCSWQLAPLTMGGSPLSQMKTNSYSGLQCGKQIEKQNYYSYNSEMHIERDNDEPKKVMHHFLDEYVPKEDMISTQRTQLSISTPNSVHDFFITQK